MRPVTMNNPRGFQPIEPGSAEDAIIREETALLAQVQRVLAERQINEVVKGEYDKELIALRDQIAEARIEDVAPLVAEMYRLQALGARTGNGRSLPVDVACPYFGHLRLKDNDKTREVLIGSRAFVPTGSAFAIVDWRHAPVSRIYYRYDEGDDFEENFGGRQTSGLVIARRTLSITDGELRRITWSEGAVARRADGQWVQLASGERPMLRGGAGTATRPPAPDLSSNAERGKLGVIGDEALREDKRLQAVTALIDRAQFDMITKPDSGIVILQGGAGSGKTTVALHRAAYLHFNNPQVFAPKRMAIVVRSPALTEYIARVLPSLGVPGIKVVTLEGWMSMARQKVLTQLKKKRVDDLPVSVARIKKHPAVLAVLEEGVQEEGEVLRDALAAVLSVPSAQQAFANKWRELERLALVPRLRDIQSWFEGVAAGRAGVTAAERTQALGILRRARGSAGDVLSTWSHLLTDFGRLRAALDARSPGQISDAEIRELIEWVTQQAEELEAPEEAENEEDAAEEKEERQRQRQGRDEAERALGAAYRTGDRAGDGDADGSGDEPDFDDRIGIDGREIDEGSPHGKLDEHDDALLLRLVQLKLGGLVIGGSQKALSYEHIVVDEAQDLSPTDIAVLRGALTRRQSMTLAGDTAQKLVFDNGFDDWKTLLSDLKVEGVELEPLRISYRSTREIVQFSRAVLGPLADPVEPVAPRSGSPVEQFHFANTGEAIALLAEALRSLILREKKASVAVIARYSAQATMYYEGLRNAEVPALRRVHGKEFSFAPGIDVVDVAQIKGLEYDYVVLVEANAATYPDTIESRHLLHIAATRAVHQLWVTSVGTPSTLLPPTEFDATIF